MKSFVWPVIISFTFGLVIGSVGVATISTYASRKVLEGDNFFLSANFPKALSSYNEAVKFWPLLLRDSNFSQRVNLLRVSEQALNSAPAITVFFKSESLESEITALAKEIREIPGVLRVNYTSKQEAYEKYIKRNKDDPTLTELVTPDILPASLEIFLNDPVNNLDNRHTVKEKIGSLDIVEEIIESPFNKGEENIFSR